MARKARLDAELVRRGLARSRQHAVDLVADGKVKVGGLPAHKAATAVAPDTPLQVLAAVGESVVSRGAHKLSGALDRWPDLRIDGRRCLDAGASTGGFTQILLRRGAARVIAVDVGYGQLAWELRTDDRVEVHDRTNVREISPATIGGTVEVIVADLSFISLRTVLPALSSCLAADGDAVVMVKPQFEVGREAIGAGGVVRDATARANAVLEVAQTALEHGLGTVGVTASPLPGPAGNVEYFLWLRADTGPLDPSALDAAIAAGPA